MTDGILNEDDELDRTDASAGDIKKTESQEFERLLAVAFINAADKARYQEVTTNLEMNT